MKKAIFLFLLFAPMFCAGQVITSFKTFPFPEDTTFCYADTITLSVNHEAGTIEIAIKNGESQFLRNDTMLIFLSRDGSALNTYNGKCSYTISATVSGEKSKTYFLKGPINYIEIHDSFFIISFKSSPSHLIKFSDFKK